jgi:hypothetical protein
MLDDPRWQKLWLQYCRLYSAPKDVILRDMQTGTEGADAAYVRDGRLASYVYFKTKNDAFKQAGVDALLRTGRGGGRNRTIQRLSGNEVLNPIDEGPAGTNGAAQSGLETIAMLGLVGDHLPAEFPPVPPGEENRGPRRRGGNNPPVTQPPPKTP